jgi:hypothetical protein
MESKAGYWAGPGAPPPLTAGDIETCAAPKAGFDSSLQPGGGATESNNTTRVAAREAKLAKASAKAPAAPTPAPKVPAAAFVQKKDADERKAKEAEKAAKAKDAGADGGLAKEATKELSPKEAAAAEAKKPLVVKPKESELPPA